MSLVSAVLLKTVIDFQALKDLDYEVRDKMFVEALLDIEFSDMPGRGVLYVGELLVFMSMLLMLF